MSSYLFILCMEKVVLSVTEKVLAGEWLPIHLTRGGPCIYHLMFMDDVLLFCKAKNSQVRLVISILEKLCDASGLKSNFVKSLAM